MDNLKDREHMACVQRWANVKPQRNKLEVKLPAGHVDPYERERLATIAIIHAENTKLAAWYEAKRNTLAKAEALFGNTVEPEAPKYGGLNATNSRFSSGRKASIGLGKLAKEEAAKAVRLGKARARLNTIERAVEKEPVERKSKFVFSGRSKLVVPGFGPGFNGKA